SAGSPTAPHVSVPVPLAWKVKEYAAPAVAGAAVTCTCVVVMTGAAGLFTVIVNAVAAEDCPNVSLTVNVKATDCFVVGVPETTPVLELSDRPSAGSPTAPHVSVPVPVAWKVKEYAAPAVAGAAVTCTCVVVIAGAAGLFTVIVNAVAAEDCPNVSLTVNVKATDCFVGGVPETTPVLALSDSPSAGRPAAPHVSVPVPEAWNVKEYADPAVPGAAVTCAWVLVIVGGAGLFTVILNCTELDWWPAALESVAVAVKVTLPLAVGVPVMAPVLALIVRPSAGSPVAVQVIAPAPPVSASAKL